MIFGCDIQLFLCNENLTLLDGLHMLSLELHYVCVASIATQLTRFGSPIHTEICLIPAVLHAVVRSQSCTVMQHVPSCKAYLCTQKGPLNCSASYIYSRNAGNEIFSCIFFVLFIVEVRIPFISNLCILKSLESLPGGSCLGFFLWQLKVIRT